MSFQAAVILSNVVFLAGLLGLKVWDLRSGRDHVWEYTFAAEQRRRGLPGSDTARPAMDPVEERKWQKMASNTEMAWLVITFLPSWMWFPPGPYSPGAFFAHQGPVLVMIIAYALVMRIFRSVWRKKFAR